MRRPPASGGPGEPPRDGDRHRALDEFVETKLARSAAARDFRARNGTSWPSPPLASGELTVADCAAAAPAAPASAGRDAWVDELAWHD